MKIIKNEYSFEIVELFYFFNIFNLKQKQLKTTN